MAKRPQERDTRRAMSRENVEIVQRLVEAFNEGGFGAPEVFAFFDADAVFEEPPEQPGATVAHGRDSVAETFGRFDATWEEHRSQPEEIRALDDERVLMLSVEHFRGRDQLQISQPCGTVFTLREGKVVRMQSFWERATALEAAALTD